MARKKKVKAEEVKPAVIEEPIVVEQPVKVEEPKEPVVEEVQEPEVKVEEPKPNKVRKTKSASIGYCWNGAEIDMW